MLHFIFALFIGQSFVFAEAGKLTPGSLSGAESNLLVREAKRLWEKRDVKENLQESLSKFELAYESNPTDFDTLVYLTRGYLLLGDGHEDNKDLKARDIEKAVAFGDKALLTNEEYAKKLKKEDVEDAIDVLGEREVPAMFWLAASLGKHAKLTGIMASLRYKGKIKALVERVEKLKPDFFHGSVPRYWGGYYAVVPGIAGGDMKKSKKYFEKALEMAPEYLGTKVLMAETYYVEEGDKKEFKKLLLEVIQDKSNDPELGPENNIERKKAEKLLEKEEDLF